MNADSESLYFAGLEALTTGNRKEAEHYAHALSSEGSTMGWELQARLQVLAGLRTEAVETLRNMLGLMDIGSREEEQTTMVRFMVQLDLLEEIEDLPLDQENVELSVLLGTAADECLKQGKLADCRRFALAAARADHDKHGALWYLREANKIQSEGALMRRIVVCGHLELQKKHCAVQYHVVSDTVEQALDFIRELEPEVSGLRLEQVLEETSRPDLPWGVYWRSPWVTSSAS